MNAASVAGPIVVRGNVALSRAGAADRRAAIYQPYHDAIAAELDRRKLRSQPTMLVSLHSFTPVVQGLARPWKFGVLHRHDSVLSHRVLHLLTARFGVEVGDNQPYSLDAKDNTIPLHADAREVDYLELEKGHDLIADEKGQCEIAEDAAEVLALSLGSTD